MSFNKDIKPSSIPTNLTGINSNHEVIFNMKGFYNDLNRRVTQ